MGKNLVWKEESNLLPLSIGVSPSPPSTAMIGLYYHQAPHKGHHHKHHSHICEPVALLAITAILSFRIHRGFSLRIRFIVSSLIVKVNEANYRRLRVDLYGAGTESCRAR